MSAGMLLQLRDEVDALLSRAIAAERGRTVADDSEVYALIAHQIQEGREALRLTQEALGALIGESSITVSRWETQSRRPSVAHLARLAGVGISVSLPVIRESSYDR